jgi:ribosomal protein S18 acetylase RimI-like enzyme
MLSAKSTIEFALPSDAIEIGELSKQYIEYDLSWRYTPERLRELLKDKSTNVVVARTDSSLAGFGIMTYAEKTANLDLLAVKLPYRRRGIGGQIVTWLEEVARTAGIVNIYVQVRKNNRGAIEFYGRCGFQIVDELGGYYGGTESGVLMCSSISQMIGTSNKRGGF